MKLRMLLALVAWCGLVGGLYGLGGCTPTGGTNNNTNSGGNDNTNDDPDDNCPEDGTQDTTPEDCPTGGPDDGSGTVSYADGIFPLFERAGCLSTACHAGQFPQSNNDLTTYENSFVGGDQAAALDVCLIVPGDAENSYLFQKVSMDEPPCGLPMPQVGARLTEEEVELVRTWIDEGAMDN